MPPGDTTTSPLPTDVSTDKSSSAASHNETYRKPKLILLAPRRQYKQTYPTWENLNDHTYTYGNRMPEIDRPRRPLSLLSLRSPFTSLKSSLQVNAMEFSISTSSHPPVACHTTTITPNFSPHTSFTYTGGVMNNYLHPRYGLST